MVKLIGPLQSTYASGTLGRLLEYSQHPRGPRAGRRRNPKQPRTLAQRSTRIFMAWLARAWSTIDVADKATWKNSPWIQSLSPYHCYLKHNVNRYKQISGDILTASHLPIYPTTSFPSTIDTAQANMSTVGFTTTSTSILHEFNVHDVKQNWVCIWHYNVDHGPLPTYRDVVGAETVDHNANFRILIKNLAAGPSRLRVWPISKTGVTRDVPYTFFFNLTG